MIFSSLFAKSPQDCSKNWVDNDVFQLPIQLIDNTSAIHCLEPHVVEDLELDEGRNTDGGVAYDGGMTAHLCDTTADKTQFLQHHIHQSKHIYTTDVEYLSQTQTVLQRLGQHVADAGAPTISSDNCNDYIQLWGDLKNTSGFMEKYGFMEFEMLNYLNGNNEFMQALATMNFLSPLTSFLIPILFFLFPFLLIRLKGIPITFQQYVDTLREISRNHFIGKLLNVTEWNVETIMYIGFTGGLYFLQLYQNAVACIHFYHNIKYMNAMLLSLRTHCITVSNQMRMFISVSGDCPKYRPFLEQLHPHLGVLEMVGEALSFVSPFDVSFRKWTQLGTMLTQLYQCHSDAAIERSLQYSAGFAGYYAMMSSISHNQQLGFATFSHLNTSIMGETYPPHLRDGTQVENDCLLRKNMIVSGINASGKTTFLKTSALNIIFTQQYGVGFYTSCVLRPYTHIHSYLNIPDTSGRDSLFQAESRRCKTILDAIQSAGEGARHFCIFDELYSGTNPKEATRSAIAFLEYLAKHENVEFILTTHYVKVCRHFRKPRKDARGVANYQMHVNCLADGRYEYTYRLKRGISKLRGGLQILKNLNYPSEIINSMEKI